MTVDFLAVVNDSSNKVSIFVVEGNFVCVPNPCTEEQGQASQAWDLELAKHLRKAERSFATGVLVG